MAKKSIKPNVEFVEESLQLIHQRIIDCKEYLEKTKWQDKTVDKDKEVEFKFQASIISTYIGWLNEYSSLSGIVDFCNEHMQEKTKEVRKGSSRSAFAEMVKTGEFE